MGPGHILEGIYFMNFDFYMPLDHEIEQIIRVLLQLLPRSNVIQAIRSDQLNILRGQAPAGVNISVKGNSDGHHSRDVKRRHRPARVPKADHAPFPRHALQALIKRRLPHAVERGGHPRPRRRGHDGRHEVVLGVVDHNFRANAPDKVDLARTTRRHDPRPHKLQHLHEPQAHPPGRRLHEHPVPALHLVRVADQRPRRQALQQRRGGVRQRDGVGHAHAARRGGDGVGRVGAVGEVGDAVADGERGRGPRRDDGAGGLAAEGEGQPGRGVEARAEVALSPASAGRGVAEEGPGRTCRCN